VSGIGPALPPGFERKKKATVTAARAATTKGPARPPQQLLDYVADTMSRDAGIGPQMATPAELAAAEDREHQERLRMLEKRSIAAKEQLTSTETVERESWMTELPDLVRKDFGSGARTFRAKAYTVDRDTGWTDSPQERKAREQADRERQTGVGRGSRPAAAAAEDAAPSDRDRMLAAQVSAHNAARRGQSLMTMHQKVQEKRKADADTGSGSAGFSWDRERDMAVNVSDPKKRKTIVDGAAGFASRFAPAKGKHFL